MLKDEYKPRMGLGRNGDDMVTLLEVAKNRGRFGLGYKPTNTDKKRVALERKEKNLVHLQGCEPWVERVLIYHISKSIQSAGWMYAGQVAMLKEEVDDDLPKRRSMMSNQRFLFWI